LSGVADDRAPESKTGPRLALAGGLLAGAVVTLGLVSFAWYLLRPDPLPEASGPTHFVEVTDSAGLDQTYDGDFTFFVGGGVAVFDCDQDMKPDVYLAGGVNPAGLFRNESDIGGDLHFTRIGDASTDLTDVTGAYPIDIDSDGVGDLVVLRLGENVLLRGLGGCRFERANETWNVDGGNEWTAAFSATWENGQSAPTLAFGNYVAVDDQGAQTGGCSDNVMFRPGPSGTYGPPLTLTPGWCTLSILFSDWARNGERDLRMTNDRHYYGDGQEQLWQLRPGTDPRLYTEAEGWQPMQIWGMGIASQDLDGDGRPEVFLTSQGDNKLQTLVAGADGPDYQNIGLTAGVNAQRPFVGDNTMPSTAWHAEFNDVNNDGYPDLFVAKGNVEAMPEFAADDPNNLLLGQPDGTFVESADVAGILDFERTRGAALVDLNLDGQLDLIDVDRRAPVRVWRNIGTGNIDEGGWLAVRLHQEGSNPDAIGSWVQVRLGSRVVEREVTVGGGHAGGQLGWIHLGLGALPEVEVRVIWPDGDKGKWVDVEADRFVVADRDSGTVALVGPVAD
jgi:enediyne biosynthesis protein E4